MGTDIREHLNHVTAMVTLHGSSTFSNPNKITLNTQAEGLEFIKNLLNSNPVNHLLAVACGRIIASPVRFLNMPVS